MFKETLIAVSVAFISFGVIQYVQVSDELHKLRVDFARLQVEAESLRNTCVCDCDQAPLWYRSNCWGSSIREEAQLLPDPPSPPSPPSPPPAPVGSPAAAGGPPAAQHSAPAARAAAPAARAEGGGRLTSGDNSDDPEARPESEVQVGEEGLERWQPPAEGSLSGDAGRDALREKHVPFKRGHVAYSERCDVSDPNPPAPAVVRPPLLFTHAFQKVRGEETAVTARYVVPAGSYRRGLTLRIHDTETGEDVLEVPDCPPEGEIELGAVPPGPLQLQLSLVSSNEGDDAQIIARSVLTTEVAPPAELLSDAAPCWPKRHTDLSRTNRLGNHCPFSPTNYANWPRMPTLCEYTSLECRLANHFFGVPGYTVGLSIFGFSRADFTFLDFIFTARTGLRHATELGTGGGLVSLFLGTTVAIRGGKLETFDVRDCRGEGIRRAWLPAHAQFRMVNIFEGTNHMHPLVLESVRRPSQLVLFDGGDKMLEATLYGPEIAKDGESLFVVHDWEDETFEAGFEDMLSAAGFSSAYEPFAQHIGTHLRAYSR